jgi:nucleoside 2-deoxyribosyltransferase
MSKQVYLGGPITGLSYSEARDGWRPEFAGLLDISIYPLSPMRQEGHLAEIKKISAHSYDYNQLSSAKGIVAKDMLDIERSAIVVFNFLGAKKISAGSVWEMGYAKRARKPILIIMEPEGNPHDHVFIVTSADFRCTSIAEAAEVVNALLLPGV